MTSNPTRGEEARSMAQEAGHRIKERGQSYFNQYKHRAADEVDHLGAAFHAASEKLREADDEKMACYADSVAQRIDRAGGYLHEREVTQILRDARDVVRAHPEWVLGGLLAGGFMLARLIKASQGHEEDEVSSQRSSHAQENTYRRGSATEPGAMGTDAPTPGVGTPASPGPVPERPTSFPPSPSPSAATPETSVPPPGASNPSSGRTPEIKP